MVKYSVVVADPAWSFHDRLIMDSVKRGAASQYSILRNEDIVTLPVKSIVADDAVLALWVPSSLLQVGLDTMKAWGFKQTQTHIWVKVKLNPFKEIWADMKKLTRKSIDWKLWFTPTELFSIAYENLPAALLSKVLAFGMGRLFRQTHEICLIGVRGKIYKHLTNRSQRSVHFAPNLKHSKKPEDLQDMLDCMFPGKEIKKLEIFARRSRLDWDCVGNQCPDSLGEDIRDSLVRIAML